MRGLRFTYCGLAGLCAGLAASCFTGSSALGLPCRTAADCGIDQSCIEGFCGGVEATGPTGSSGDSSSGSSAGSSGGMAVCGNAIVEVGEECDDGNDVDTDACVQGCKNARCGDGFVGPGEGCDDGNSDETDACLSSCAPAGCGDGVVQTPEECDDANSDDSDACLSTCVTAACGDGSVFAGQEECDDGNTLDDPTCLADCRGVWFWGTVESAAEPWTHTVDTGAVTDQWNRTTDDANSGSYSWHSGTQTTANGPAGATRLSTGVIDLTSVVGGEVELRFWHRWDFDDCTPGMAGEADGAIVEVFAGGVWTQLQPTPAYPTMSMGTSDCMGIGDPTPLTSLPGWTASSSGWEEGRVSLTPWIGGPIEVGFRVGWDCANCQPHDELGWFIDDVVVSRPF